MLDIRLKITLFAILILLLVYFIFSIRSRKVDIRYILPWLVLDFMMMFVTAFPGGIIAICRMLGIQTLSNMVFFFGMIFLLLIVFSLTITVSKLNAEIKELTQRIALDEIGRNGSFEKRE